MIIPLINEIFKEDNIGNERIEFHPNEHFIDQQDAANQKRITDMFVECCNDVMNEKSIVCVIVQRGTARPYYLQGKGIRRRVFMFAREHRQFRYQIPSS